MPRQKGKRKAKTIALPNNSTKKQLLHFRKYLDRIYYDPASVASYSTPEKLLKEVKCRNYYKNVGLRKIQNYLNRQNTYTLYRPAVTHFAHSPFVHVTHINHQFDVDLMDVSRDRSDNDGVCYLLGAIDVLSKYAYMVPMQNKEGQSVAKAMKLVLDDRKPDQICTDRGKLKFVQSSHHAFF
jgi:hypothetical protein